MNNSFNLVAKLILMSFLVLRIEALNFPKSKCPDGFRSFNRSWIPVHKGFIPSCAQNTQNSGLFWCENTPDYPTNLIKLLIENCQYNFDSLLTYPSDDELESAMKNYNKLFSSIGSNISISSHQIHHGNSSYKFSTNYNSTSNTHNVFVKDENKNEMVYENRIKRQLDSISLCETWSSLIRPKAAMNFRGDWRYLVNIEDDENNINIIIKTKICRNSESSCSSYCDIPAGYKSICQQKFVEKRIAALQPDGKKLYHDIFWFPHGCECNIILDNDDN